MARDSSRGVDPVDSTLEQLTQVADSLVDRLTFGEEETGSGPTPEVEAPREQETLDIVVSSDADADAPVVVEAEDASEPVAQESGVVADAAADVAVSHEAPASDGAEAVDIDEHLDSIFGGDDAPQVVPTAPAAVAAPSEPEPVRTEESIEPAAAAMDAVESIEPRTEVEIEAGTTEATEETTDDEPAAILQMDGSYVTTGVADEARELCDSAVAVEQTPEPAEPAPYVPYEVDHGPTPFWPVAAVAAVILLGGGIWLVRSMGWLNGAPTPTPVAVTTPEPAPVAEVIGTGSSPTLDSAGLSAASESLSDVPMDELLQATPAKVAPAKVVPAKVAPAKVAPAKVVPAKVAPARAVGTVVPVEAPVAKAETRTTAPISEAPPIEAAEPVASRPAEASPAETASRDASTAEGVRQTTSVAPTRSVPVPTTPEPSARSTPQIGKAVRLAVPVRRNATPSNEATVSSSGPSPTVTRRAEPATTDRAAEPLRRVEPTLAPQVRVKGTGVAIELSVLVDDQGNVIRVVVEDGAGRPDLESASIDAMLRWKFRPATENGQPVRSWITQTFRFEPES